MNISRRDQILLLGMVILLAAFAFFRFAYLPAREEIQSLSTTRQELQQEKEGLEKEAKKTSVARQDVEQKFANLNKRLPTEDELVPLLSILDNSCKKFKLPLSSLDYKGAEQKSTDGLQTLVFTVGTKGKVSQLFDFLNELETNQRLISVLDVSFNAVKAEPVNTTEVESGPPAYYIAPPGMPQAKLQRVTFEIEATEEAVSQAEIPVAASFVPDNFEMKITINAYYVDQALSRQVSKSEGNTVKDNEKTDNSKDSQNDKDTKGEV